LAKAKKIPHEKERRKYICDSLIEVYGSKIKALNSINELRCKFFVDFCLERDIPLSFESLESRKLTLVEVIEAIEEALKA
jgi:hypothetical protein